MGSSVLVVQYIKHRSYKCNVPHRAVLKFEQKSRPVMAPKEQGRNSNRFFTRVGQVLKIALKPLLGFKPNIKVYNLGYQEKKPDFDG